MLLEIFTVLLIINLALFTHEMGHAIATVLQNQKAKAEIYFGSSSKEKKLKLKLGRITCYLTIAISAFCRTSNPEELPRITLKQRFWELAGGPIASLAGFVIFYFTSQSVSGVAESILINLAGVNLFLFVTPLIPFTYPSFLGGLPSDGLQILNLFKQTRKQSKAVL